MSSAPQPPAQPPPLQFPQPLQNAVLQIKTLVATYETTTDPTLKASYKAVIVDRVALAQTIAKQYSDLVSTNLTALLPS